MNEPTFYKNFYHTYSNLLNDFIKRYTTTLKEQGTKNIKKFTKLYIQTTANFLNTPGKYLRPYFSFIAYTAITSRIFNTLKRPDTSITNDKATNQSYNIQPEKIIGTTPLIIGTFIELIHNHLLIHDDIMDKSIKRRDNPTVWKTFNSALLNRHDSYSLAILSGNTALLMAFRLLNFLKPLNKQALQNIIQTTYEYIETVIQGQIADITLHSFPVQRITQKDILWVYKHKTAIYTTEFPVTLVAHMFNSSISRSKNLIKALQNLGVAFQVIDDLKDFIPGSKSIFTDIKERKYTILLSNALAQANKIERRYLLNIYSHKKYLTQLQLQKISTIILKNGYSRTIKFTDDLINSSKKLIGDLDKQEQFIFNNQLYTINQYYEKIKNSLNSLYLKR